jgi:hypothetical protein
LADLAALLVRTRNVKPGLELLGEVLKVSPPASSRDFGQPRFEDWTYQQILSKTVPDIVEIAGLDALWLLCRILESGSNRTLSSDLYSSAWRSAIEDHEQNRSFGEPEDHLLDAIRDGLARLISKAPALGPQILEHLESTPSELFRRLAIHLASDVGLDAARTRLVRPENLNDAGIHHEYSVLLRKTFPLLNTEDREHLLSMLNSEAEEVLRSDKDGAERSARWLLRRLSLLAGHLPENMQSKYSSLVERFGPVEHPDFLAYHTSWVGPTSPASAEDLEKLSAGELANLLRTWQPSGDWHGPSHEGLARELTGVVRNKVAEISTALRLFRDIDPTFSRAIVDGLSEGFRSGHQVDWPAVLPYLAWIVSNDRSVVYDSRQTLDRDPHWGWARKSVARFLETALDKGAFAWNHTEAIWSILSPITKDPDPSNDDDIEKYGDVVHRSINHTRPVAFHALIALTQWLHSLAKDSAADVSSLRTRAFSVLDEHLDPEKDSSPSVRSIYGQYLEWLFFLDREWTSEHLVRIFDGTRPELRNAAWLGYLLRARLNDDVFSRLKSDYERFVLALDSLNLDNRNERDAAWRVSEHLVILVGRGTIAPDAPLISWLFSKAPPAIRAHAIGYVGRALNSEGLKLEQSFVANWQQLWEWRSGPKAPPLSREEWAEFSWWFSSGRFEVTWSVTHLLRAIREAKTVAADPFLFEKLEEIAQTHPESALSILEELVSEPGSKWGLLGLSKHGLEILRTCLKTDELRPQVEAVVHRLGALGYREFGDLLRKAPPEP